eukprot:m.67727 g.67727  ORF g.67727 m.67727 type:complete len:382 (+) comp19831_c0_seq2:245-1390(+)
MARSGCDVLVGTPGRLLDHFKRKSCDVYTIQTLVLDEVDLLLDMGFLSDIQQIRKFLPSCQTLLFSATLPESVQKLARDMCRDPVHIAVDPQHHQERMERLELFSIELSGKDQFAFLLTKVFRAIKYSEKIVIFFPTRVLCDVMKDVCFMAQLPRQNIAVIHGGQQQHARTRTADHFRRAAAGVLITTDVSARGMHYPDVQEVLHYGSPSTVETYTHRIGRTARAGKTGRSTLVLSQQDRPFLTSLKKSFDITSLPNEVDQDHKDTVYDFFQYNSFKAKAVAGSVFNFYSQNKAVLDISFTKLRDICASLCTEWDLPQNTFRIMDDRNGGGSRDSRRFNDNHRRSAKGNQSQRQSKHRGSGPSNRHRKRSGGSRGDGGRRW